MNPDSPNHIVKGITEKEFLKRFEEGIPVEVSGKNVLKSIRLSEKYKNTFSKKDSDDFENHTKESRNDW